MGIKWLRELYVLVDGAVRPRPCQDCPPYVLKEELDQLYGKGKWCVVWDIAWDRQALDDSKTNKRTAVKGARMVFDALNEEGIPVVACLESENWGDYRSGTERDNGYRVTGGRRPQVQFDHEKAVIDSLGKKGLMVAPRANCCGELAAAQLIGKEFEPEDGEPLLCAMLKSADSDAQVFTDKTLTVDEINGKKYWMSSSCGYQPFISSLWGGRRSCPPTNRREYYYYSPNRCKRRPPRLIALPLRSAYDRLALLKYYQVGLDALAMFCALSDAFGSSNGRTCLGACALDCLLKEGPGDGDYELEEVMGALRYVSSLPRRGFPAGTARTVAARFRCFVERTVPLPAAAPGDSPRGGLAVAAAIVAFLQDPARSTTRGYETHRQRVLHELWDFADYILDEVNSHSSLSPALKFNAARWP